MYHNECFPSSSSWFSFYSRKTHHTAKGRYATFLSTLLPSKHFYLCVEISLYTFHALFFYQLSRLQPYFPIWTRLSPNPTPKQLRVLPSLSPSSPIPMIQLPQQLKISHQPFPMFQSTMFPPPWPKKNTPYPDNPSTLSPSLHSSSTTTRKRNQKP